MDYEQAIIQAAADELGVNPVNIRSVEVDQHHDAWSDPDPESYGSFDYDNGYEYWFNVRFTDGSSKCSETLTFAQIVGKIIAASFKVAKV